MGSCCEYNRNNIDEGNLGGKIQYQAQITREDRIKSQNKEMNNTNSINGNLSGISDYNQIDNLIGRKDPDNQIPINPPKFPHDKIPESIINSRKKLKLIIIQSKYINLEHQTLPIFNVDMDSAPPFFKKSKLNV